MYGTKRQGRGPIRVLLIEAFSGDADPARQELERAQFEVCTRRARSAEELARRCLDQPYDAIVCDMTTDALIAMDALELVRQRDSHVPVIALIDAPDECQTAQEDTLTECLLRGATDCLDRNHVRLLPVAVAFAVEQRILTEKRDQVERELERSRERYEARSAMEDNVMQHVSEVERG